MPGLRCPPRPRPGCRPRSRAAGRPAPDDLVVVEKKTEIVMSGAPIPSRAGWTSQHRCRRPAPVRWCTFRPTGWRAGSCSPGRDRAARRGRDRGRRRLPAAGAVDDPLLRRPLLSPSWRRVAGDVGQWLAHRREQIGTHRIGNQGVKRTRSFTCGSKPNASTFSCTARSNSARRLVGPADCTSCREKMVRRRSRIVWSRSSTAVLSRCAVSGPGTSRAMPCNPSPTANNRWMTRS